MSTLDAKSQEKEAMLRERHDFEHFSLFFERAIHSQCDYRHVVASHGSIGNFAAS